MAKQGPTPKRRNKRLPSAGRQARSDELFEIYWEMGDSRSIRKLAEKTGKSFHTLKHYAEDFHWSERVYDRQQKVSREQSLKTEKLIAQFQSYQVKYLIKRLDQFQRLTIDSPIESLNEYLALAHILKDMTFTGDGGTASTSVIVVNSIPGE